MHPKELLTPWHEEYDRVTEKTHVYFVPKTLTLVHQCSLRTDFNTKPAQFAQKNMIMRKPALNANSSCYCDKCDLLYIGEDPNVAVQKEKTPRVGVAQKLHNSANGATPDAGQHL